MIKKIFNRLVPAAAFSDPERRAFYTYISSRSLPILHFVYLIGGAIPLAYLAGDFLVENRPDAAVVVRVLYLSFWLMIYIATFLTPRRLPLKYSYPLYTLVGIAATCFIEGHIFQRPEYILATSLLYLIGLVISYTSPWLLAVCGSISVLVPAVMLPGLGVSDLDSQRVIFFHAIWAIVVWLASLSILRLNIRLFRAETQLKEANKRYEQALEQEARLREEIEHQAKTDPLTGLYNRREFYRLANQAMEVATRYIRPLSLIILDIDHFKQINDQFGHFAGDAVIRAVANICSGSARKSDVVARFGGEEFVLLLQESNREQAMEFAERLRMNVENSSISDEQGNFHKVTISAGIACLSDQGQVDILLSLADDALYRAKSEGRNVIRAA